MSAPTWATSVPSVDIHSLPATQAQPPFSWQQMQATVQFFLDSFIGQIAVAFGGIEILGWKPFEFLADWGEKRIAEARDAYLKAVSAQDTANDASEDANQTSNLLTSITKMLQQVQSKLAVHDQKIENLRKELDTEGEEVGGTDPCDTVAKVTNVEGTVAASFFGYWYSNINAASFIYDDQPATDRSGVGAVLTSKQPGVVRLDTACNAAKTNGAALQLKVNNWRTDEISIGYLTGPNTFHAVTTIKMELPKDSAWQLWYHPGDPDDPSDPWANTFFVLLNGVEVRALRWTDGGNFVQHGVDYRYQGGCCNAAEDLLTRGTAITEFGWYDYIKAVPE